MTSDRVGGMVTRNTGYDVLGRTTSIQSGTGNALQNLAYGYYAVGNSQYGNLGLRFDNNKGLVEAFTYDGLNRLTSSQATGQAPVAVSYDSFGNIIARSDRGTYSYGVNAGPHAVTGISGTGATVTYDANGNGTVVSDRTITYNTFDKPVQMARGSYSAAFTYGPDLHSGVNKILGIEMHDWTFLTVNIDWAIGSAEFFFRNRKSEIVVIEIEELSDLHLPRLQDWGPSVSVNEVNGPYDVSGGLSKLEIQMQSGDLILLTAKRFKLPVLN